MKKVLVLLICLLMLFNITVFAASEPEVRFTIDGGTKKGDKITLYVKVKDVDRLYAASVDYIYNPEELKVTYIGGADLITNNQGILELGGETEKDGNRASYQMTFTGKVDGLKGSGNLVKIEAEVLKDCDINLEPENMKIKLVNVDNSYNVSNMTFKYESFTTIVNGEEPSDSNRNTNTNKPNEGVNNTKPNENKDTAKEESQNNENINSENNDKDKKQDETEIENNDNKEKDNTAVVGEEENDKKPNDDKENKLETSISKKNGDNESTKNGTSYVYILVTLLILGMSVGGYIFVKKRNKKIK